MESILIKALQLILSLSILVIVHEFGHFIFARIFKVRVEKFYMFFNPWFSIFRMKKINGRWHFKYFSRNDINTRRRYDFEGKKIEETIPAEQLSDNNWRKYPETTEYGIGWAPLGGYVKIAGMIDESMDKEQLAQPVQPYEFRAKPTTPRLLIMVGGVLMNLIFAFFVYSMIIFAWGDNYVKIDKTPLYFSDTAHKAGFKDGDIILAADGKKLQRYDDLEIFKIIDGQKITILRDEKEEIISLPKDFSHQVLASKTFFADTDPTVVDSVIPGMNAQKGGLQAGDQVISVNGSGAIPFAVFSSILKKNKLKEIEITVQRDSTQTILNVMVDKDGKIGFNGKSGETATFVKDKYGFFGSIPAGASYCIRKLSFYVLQLKLIFTKVGLQSLGGFGAIGNMFPAQWNWFSFWNLTALLSIMLGVMNLLPIPALDGGHVIFLLYEVITRRKPSDKFMEHAQMAGMVFIIALLVYANGNDILKFFFK